MKAKNVTVYAEGDCVFTRVKGHPPWPSKVTGVHGSTPSSMKYDIYFYGTAEVATVKSDSMFPYLKHKAKFGNKPNNKIFMEGMRLIEEENDLSPDVIIVEDSPAPSPTPKQSEQTTKQVAASKSKAHQNAAVKRPSESASASTNAKVRRTSEKKSAEVDNELNNSILETSSNGCLTYTKGSRTVQIPQTEVLISRLSEKDVKKGSPNKRSREEVPQDSAKQHDSPPKKAKSVKSRTVPTKNKNVEENVNGQAMEPSREYNQGEPLCTKCETENDISRGAKIVPLKKSTSRKSGSVTPAKKSGDVKAFTVGENVFAKVRGYPHWPAVITGIDEKPQLPSYFVNFYFTDEVATLKPQNIFPYNDKNKEKYGKPDNKRKGFAEALIAIEESIKAGRSIKDGNSGTSKKTPRKGGKK